MGGKRVYSQLCYLVTLILFSTYLFFLITSSGGYASLFINEITENSFSYSRPRLKAAERPTESKSPDEIADAISKVSRRNIVIWSYWRSGTSFLGQLIANTIPQEVFYRYV